MDATSLNAILTKYGKDNCLQIMFNNGKVMNLVKFKMDSTATILLDRTKPTVDATTKKHSFYTFDELVTINTSENVLEKKEHEHVFSGIQENDYNWLAVYPIDMVSGFFFMPSDLTEDQKYTMKSNWNKDHH